MKRAMTYALAAGLVLGTGSLAHAQYNSDSGSTPAPGSRAGGGMGQSGTAAPGSKQSQAAQIPESEVKLALESHGFTNVRDVKQRGDKITAKADKDGKEQKVEIDTTAGTLRAGN